MKSFKKALSLLLMVLMIFSAFSVSASAKKQTVKWDEYGETVNYTKAKSVKVGDSTFSSVGNYAHRFTAEKEGIYSVTISAKEKENADGMSYSCMVSKSSTDTTATDFAEFSYSEEYETVYYFKAGESQFIGVCTEGDVESYTLSVKYLGKVTDVSVKDASRPLQANYDVILSDGLMIFARGVVFHTDLGKDVCISDVAVSTKLKTLKAGNVSARIAILGINKKITFPVFLAQDEIKKITTAKGFKAPTAYVDKDGEFMGYEIGSSALLVNVVLKNGKVIKNKYADGGEVRVVLEDGREINLMPTVEMENGKCIYYLSTSDGYIDDTNDGSLFKVSEAKMILEGEEGGDEEPEEKLTLLGILKKISEFINGLFKSLMALLPTNIIKGN